MSETPEPGRERALWDRRRFLAAAAAGAIGAGLPEPRRRLLQMNGYPIDAETPLEDLSSYITGNDIFFVRHHWNPVFPDASAWALSVDGEVERPLRLSLGDLKKMSPTSAICVLQCAGNGRALHRPIVPGVQWRFGAVGNARWTGVRVSDVLQSAQVKPTARHLHGGPVRLVVPGWAGDHWMKWLVRLSAQPERQTGFYMDTAYRYPKNPGEPGVPVKPEDTDPVRDLFVKSSITQAPREGRVGAILSIGGFALSGAPDIAKVDVSDDDGGSWRPAQLGAEHAPYSWRLWSFSYTPKAAGRVVLVTRATDSRGNVQPRKAAWNPSGYLYNAWPSAEIAVRA